MFPAACSGMSGMFPADDENDDKPEHIQPEETETVIIEDDDTPEHIQPEETETAVAIEDETSAVAEESHGEEHVLNNGLDKDGLSTWFHCSRFFSNTLFH